MKLGVIVPITGELSDLDGKVHSVLAPLLSPDTEVVIRGIDRGFPSVECELHSAYNTPGVLAAASGLVNEGCSGIFVSCFDEPGVLACRENLTVPVLGAYAPAMSYAGLLGDRYAVLTTDEAGILSEERKARTYRFSPAAIRAVDMEVTDLRRDRMQLVRRLTEACLILWKTERISAAVLGCTGMFPAAGELRQLLAAEGCPVQVVEPFAQGLCALETMVRLGLSNHVSGAAVRMERLKWY